MKVNKIIALQAPHNKGKSETLRNTWKLLDTKFELVPIEEANDATKVCIYRDNTIHEAKENSVDYHSLFLTNGDEYNKLGICTAGDDEETIERAMNFFVENKCEMVIIACLTRGKTVHMLKKFSDDIKYISKKVSSNEAERYSLNKDDAKVIFEFLIGTIKMNKIQLNDYKEYFNQGLLYKAEKDYNQAEKAYKKAIELNPRYEKAYNSLGVLYRSQGKEDLAEKEYKKAIELNPRYENAYNNLGVLYRSQGKEDLAEEEYKKAIEINSKYEKAYYNLGILYKSQGKVNLAEEEYKKAIELNPKYEKAYYNLGQLYKSQGKEDLAEKAYKTAIEINPKYEKAYNNLGTLYQDKKDYPKATKVYKKLIEINPEYSLAYYNLGTLYNEQEDGCVKNYV